MGHPRVSVTIEDRTTALHELNRVISRTNRLWRILLDLAAREDHRRPRTRRTRRLSEQLGAAALSAHLEHAELLGRYYGIAWTLGNAHTPPLPKGDD